MNINKKIEIMCLSYHHSVTKYFGISRRQYLLKEKIRRRKFKALLVKRLQSSTKLYAAMLKSNLLLANKIKRAPPKIWMKRRSEDWWINIVNSNDFDEWFENFRIDKNTYEWLCEKLEPELKPGMFCVRKPLSVKKKVAIALYKLASCAEYRVVGNQFGVHKASVHRSLKQFCAACVKVLLRDVIKKPNLDEATQMIHKFEVKSGVPLVFGAIDGTHIPITPPSNGYRDFINKKNWASVVLQGLVDADYRYKNIYTICMCFIY